MVDVVTALIKHLRSDATVTAQITSTGILPDIDPDAALPTMAVTSMGGGGNCMSETVRVTFYIRAKPSQRNKINAVLDRLHTLFAEQGNYVIGSGTPQRRCIFSQAIVVKDIRQEQDSGPLWGRAEYSFVLAA